jgi:hypothetical protein
LPFSKTKKGKYFNKFFVTITNILNCFID